jgi:hypothetical protein
VGFALRRPPTSRAAVYRETTAVARAQGWREPSCVTMCDAIRRFTELTGYARGALAAPTHTRPLQKPGLHRLRWQQAITPASGADTADRPRVSPGRRLRHGQSGRSRRKSTSRRCQLAQPGVSLSRWWIRCRFSPCASEPERRFEAVAPSHSGPLVTRRDGHHFVRLTTTGQP